MSIPLQSDRSALPTPPASEPGAGALSDAVTRLRRSLRRAIRPETLWEALPMAQVEILQLLAEQPGLTIGEVATTQRLAPNTVSTLIGTLLRDGLIERRADAADRRVGRVSLTQQGTDRLDAWRYAHELLIDDAIQALPPEQREALEAAVDAINALASVLIGDPRDDTPIELDSSPLPDSAHPGSSLAEFGA